MSDEKIVFDEETGLPMKRVTIRLKGRTDEQIMADIDAAIGIRVYPPEAPDNA